MWVGWIEFDILLGDVHSLKEKRSYVRPLIADLRRKFQLSASEVDHLDLHRRVAVGVCAASSARQHLVELIDDVERYVANRPEIDLLASRRGYHHSED
ncbi:DUF503 domain-containing protein [Ruicaihuangia caeni]|uniref:DUF503 domain-containing protein n=1 Tax=Ruicaihuangia caeni TaxID=3042517 RepID=A0AAW6T3F0_9MICO|nr:DUF503 domain-containing protein [Klugiella sp. YN-L-19]MDI2098272.1 DUF503 domain-containing protein [Klugiella sp. YN-L-19]